MYKQDLEQTLLGIDEEAELEIGPRDDRPNVYWWEEAPSC